MVILIFRVFLLLFLLMIIVIIGIFNEVILIKFVVIDLFCLCFLVVLLGYVFFVFINVKIGWLNFLVCFIKCNVFW